MNYQFYEILIQFVEKGNIQLNILLHTSVIPMTHKITEDHKEHTELFKMLIMNMHTCTKVVVTRYIEKKVSL